MGDRPASREEILARIFVHLEEHLGRPTGGPLSAGTRLVADLHLDSIESTEMLCALEDAYDVVVPLSALQRAESLGDVAAAVAVAVAAPRGA